MAKYSYEFKKQVIEAYLSGEGGYKYLAKRYGVPAWSNIKKWVRNYETHGDKGLMRSRKQDKYSFEKKLSVVELYLTSELSYQELALREGIYNPSQICKLVKDFQIAGPDALRPHKKGRKKTLGTSNKKLNIEQDTTTVPVDTSTEHVKELEDETRTMIIYEAPHRLLKTLKELSEVLGGSRAVTICKELTKRYENSMVTTLAEACSYYENNQPRGEYVLVIAGKDRNELKEEAQAQWLTMSEQEHVDMYIAQGLDKKEAMKAAARDRGVSKRDIYNKLLGN